MGKRSIILLCVLIAVCIVGSIWSGAADARQDFTISPLQMAGPILFTPLLWVCIGKLIGGLLAQNFKVAGGVRRGLRAAGVVLLAVYVFLAVDWAAGLDLGIPWTAFYWFVTHAAVLAAPGLLLGLSVKGKEPA